jgi:ABC-type branched-subunit amino acid transport system ATPase component/ABC-type branched-subunit amino acid transport system permease subunit
VLDFQWEVSINFGLFQFDFQATSQLLFNGLVTGMVFGLLAMGIVLIYRSTRVINFAVGNMGVPAATLMAVMVVNYNFPFWVALVIALLVGTIIGAAIELTVIRRLFTAPRVILLVATIGVAQLMQAINAALPDIETGGGARYPVSLGSTWDDVAGLRVTGPQVAILVLVPLVATGLGLFLNRTTFGKTVQGSAANPELARLSGFSPKRVSTLVWTLAGFLASLSAILLSGQSGSLSGFENLGPNTMVRALAAAVIAGMRSFPLALAAGISIGVIQALVRFNFLDEPGLTDLLLFIAILIAVYFQGRSEREERASYSFAPRVKAVPERLKQYWIVRNLTPVFFMICLGAMILIPFLVTQPSKHLTYATIASFAICAASLTILTGWSGQISLGQMAFAGVGALSAAAFNRAGVPFVLSMVAGAAVAAVVAALIGIGALRVRGLMLAVVTFAFALAAEQYFYRTELLSDGNSGSVPFRRGDFLGLDLNDQRTYYWFSLGVLVIVLIVIGKLRRSGIGRNTIAVRDNPDTAAAYTVRPVITKLRAFAIAGAIAGLGGSVLAGVIQNIPLSERFFTTGASLQLVSIIVIGGLGSLVGPVLGALWVIGLPTFFPDNDLVPLFSSSIGLLVLLLYVPGGLVQIGYALRDGLLRWLEARVPEPEKKRVTEPPRALTRAIEVGKGPATLSATNVIVDFGGIRAVSEASIDVQDGEIVGLIGTNGAGKTTFMNAIGGFVPSSGTVTIGGDDVSSWAPAKRAREGLGRTFQAAFLFQELTVRETVQVALEGRGRTGFLSTALFLPSATKEERHKRSEATDLIDFLGLGRYADSYIADLSTGTRRIVELAGLLALDARVLCMDEPTAGIAQRETEAFAPLLVRIRQELEASILVIEHDMPMIMSISDRVYCLEAGTVIAEGLPDDVRNNPSVVASYLGTDERAIQRSDAKRPTEPA